jgi:REP element-mobilizing transposase RayT
VVGVALFDNVILSQCGSLLEYHSQVDVGFELHAYYLMSNHARLLFREKQLGDISLIMKRLLTKYAMYFNRKYQRSGALIASRYKSVPVEIDEYFIPLQRYIHQKPAQSWTGNKLEDFPFSSYREYIFGGELVDTVLSIGIVGKDEWISLHQAITDEVFEISGQVSLTDDEIRRRIMSYTHGREPHEIGSWVRAERDLLLRKLKEEGLSIRQIERVTGISRGVVAKS